MIATSGLCPLELHLLEFSRNDPYTNINWVTSGAVGASPKISRTFSRLPRAVGSASVPAGDRAALVGSAKILNCRPCRPKGLLILVPIPCLSPCLTGRECMMPTYQLPRSPILQMRTGALPVEPIAVAIHPERRPHAVQISSLHCPHFQGSQIIVAFPPIARHLPRT